MKKQELEFIEKLASLKNENATKEQVEELVEKFGGRLNAIATLNKAEEIELKDYLKTAMGVVKVIKEDDTEYINKDGKVYELDTVKKTLKRVYKDFKDIDIEDFDDIITDKVMPMTTYRRYLKDRFGEDAPIKKGKLHFRGYRISCDAEDGFVVEDTTDYYAIVETPFEGIPTPRELGDWFDSGKEKRTLTLEEYNKAVERGKELTEKAKFKPKEVVEDEQPDFEALRKETLKLLASAINKDTNVEPKEVVEMIPFKRWKRNVRALYKQWKERKIRYPKFLKEVEKITKEETFVIEEKRHRSSFVGTFLPEHKSVGMLVGDKIEVDGKWIDAVPFLLEYLLHYEKRCMSQIMKYANGEITYLELLANPMEIDWRVEYKPRELMNTAHNARVLCMVYEKVGIVPPQDLLYEAEELKVGDKIHILINGEVKTRTIASMDHGITLGKEVGLLKLDKWVKIIK